MGNIERKFYEVLYDNKKTIRLSDVLPESFKKMQEEERRLIKKQNEELGITCNRLLSETEVWKLERQKIIYERNKNYFKFGLLSLGSAMLFDHLFDTNISEDVSTGLWIGQEILNKTNSIACNMEESNTNKFTEQSVEDIINEMFAQAEEKYKNENKEVKNK